MADWKTELGEFIGAKIADLHAVIEKYLELAGDPDKIPIEDIVTVVQMTGIFDHTADQDFLAQAAGEFLVYHGYGPVPVDDTYFERI